MAIIVNCSDGKIKIGGDFKRALAKVKAVTGRKYDPANKEWTVPAPMKSFDMCGHPIDVIHGNGSNRFQAGAHQTAYGNVYSRDEWQMDREADKAAAEAIASFGDQKAALKAKYSRQLHALGLDGRATAVILNYNFEDQIQRGAVKFSSPEREEKIMAIHNGYMAELMAIWQAEEEAEDVARQSVYAKYDFE